MEQKVAEDVAKDSQADQYGYGFGWKRVGVIGMFHSFNVFIFIRIVQKSFMKTLEILFSSIPMRRKYQNDRHNHYRSTNISSIPNSICKFLYKYYKHSFLFRADTLDPPEELAELLKETFQACLELTEEDRERLKDMKMSKLTSLVLLLLYLYLFSQDL